LRSGLQIWPLLSRSGALHGSPADSQAAVRLQHFSAHDDSHFLDRYASLLLTSLRILSYMPVMVSICERAVQCIRPNYRISVALDKEFTGLLMYGDYSLIFGFAVPIIIPLVCVVFAVQTAVLHYAVSYLGIQTVQDGQPSLRYMWVSLALGYGLVTWFFYENQLHGKWLVYFGIPVTVLMVIIVLRRHYIFPQKFQSSSESECNGEPYHKFADNTVGGRTAGSLAECSNRD